MLLGVRPEDIHDPAYIPPDITPTEVEAVVDVTELMGNEVVMYLQSGKANYLARVDPRTDARIGMTMNVVMNTQNMHLFDADYRASNPLRKSIAADTGPYRIWQGPVCYSTIS